MKRRKKISNDSVEKAYPLGMDLIESGRCPAGDRTAMACTICLYGHMTECHHPYTCEEANCGHFQGEAIDE